MFSYAIFLQILFLEVSPPFYLFQENNNPLGPLRNIQNHKNILYQYLTIHEGYRRLNH